MGIFRRLSSISLDSFFTICYNIIIIQKLEFDKRYMKKKILVVVGPTAVGKTALGIRLAQAFDGEIISGDSQQVYRGLDIGTAKATPTEQAAARHHLIDVRNLTENFSAYDFVTAANLEIEQILARKKIPIIVGGTGLYVQALIDGYHLGGQNQHNEMMQLREYLTTLSDELLFEKVHEQGLKITELNRRRAVRALELAAFGDGENKPSPYEFLLIGLTAERKILYERINQRVDGMMLAGLLDETKLLYEQFPNVQAAKAIGYKEFFPYFAGESEIFEATELVKRNSRRYAKRQLTWFRNRMAVKFYDVLDENYPENVLASAKNFLEERDIIE